MADELLRCSLCAFDVQCSYLSKTTHICRVHVREFKCSICDFRAFDRSSIAEHITASAQHETGARVVNDPHVETLVNAFMDLCFKRLEVELEDCDAESHKSEKHSSTEGKKVSRGKERSDGTKLRASRSARGKEATVIAPSLRSRVGIEPIDFDLAKQLEDSHSANSANDPAPSEQSTANPNETKKPTQIRRGRSRKTEVDKLLSEPQSVSSEVCTELKSRLRSRRPEIGKYAEMEDSAQESEEEPRAESTPKPKRKRTSNTSRTSTEAEIEDAEAAANLERELNGDPLLSDSNVEPEPLLPDAVPCVRDLPAENDFLLFDAEIEVPADLNLNNLTQAQLEQVMHSLGLEEDAELIVLSEGEEGERSSFLTEQERSAFDAALAAKGEGPNVVVEPRFVNEGEGWCEKMWGCGDVENQAE